MRILGCALCVLALSVGCGLAHAEGIGWQEAVARLAHERTRAETCVRLFKTYGDAGALSRGDLAYGEAKAEVDAVIAGLVIALAKDEEPASLPDLGTPRARSRAARLFASRSSRWCRMPMARKTSSPTWWGARSVR
jgi:hypothetical protein